MASKTEEMQHIVVFFTNGFIYPFIRHAYNTATEHRVSFVIIN